MVEAPWTKEGRDREPRIEEEFHGAGKRILGVLQSQNSFMGT